MRGGIEYLLQYTLEDKRTHSFEQIESRHLQLKSMLKDSKWDRLKSAIGFARLAIARVVLIGALYT